MQTCYFAGTCTACLKDPSELTQQDVKDISNLAKIHIENAYSVVGLEHHLESSFLLLEAYLPYFFRGLLRAFRQSSYYSSSSSGAQAKRIGSLNNLDDPLMLQNKMIAIDLDVYQFVLQRFQRQLQTLISRK